MQSFSDLGLRTEIAGALESFGFSGPTDIQRLCAPAVLAGQDAYISSATGSGKTFGYLAPILSSLDPDSQELGAIIVAPTHDLAAQLNRESQRLIQASGLGFRLGQALGSMPLQRQKEQLKLRPQLLIGSAGRIRDLLDGRYINASHCRYIVLDEGDRLFENEAIDISADLLKRLPEGCARLLVSATIQERIVQRSQEWFRQPQHIQLDPAVALRESIEHWCFHAPSRKKIDFLRRFEAAVRPERCLLFVSSNAGLHQVAEKLGHLGIQSVILRSDKSNTERKSAVGQFASGEVRWLLSTDLGARGLDIDDISHVISYDLPEEASVYVHRAGRTGRAGKRGISVAVTDLVELKRASKIAVRYNFPFICKILDSGHVHNIEPENFFALAEESEANKQQPADNLTRSPRPHPRSSRAKSSQGRPLERDAYQAKANYKAKPGSQPSRQPAPPQGRQAEPGRQNKEQPAPAAGKSQASTAGKSRAKRPGEKPKGRPGRQRGRSAPKA